MCQSWKTTNGEPNHTSTENFQIKHRNYQNRAKQPVVVVDTGHGDATERDFSPLPTRPDLVDVNCHRVIVATDWGDSGSVHRANYRRKHVESECAIDYLFPDSPDGTHLHCTPQSQVNQLFYWWHEQSILFLITSYIWRYCIVTQFNFRTNLLLERMV